MRLPSGLLLCLSLGACLALAGCKSLDTPRHATLSTDMRLQVAEAAEASGDNELAISMYTAAAAREPNNTALQLRCANALTRRGYISEARQILAERVRTSNNQPELIRALASINLVAGQPALAITGFDQLLAMNPKDSRALINKAVAQDLLGQHAAAQVIYRQVLATAPNDDAARNDLAVSMMLEGRTRQALETLAPMGDLDTSPPRLKVNLGLLYAATGNMERSRQLLGDRVSAGELAEVTRSLASFAAAGGT